MTMMQITPYKVLSWCVTAALVISISCVYLATQLPSFPGNLSVVGENVFYQNRQLTNPVQVKAISNDQENWLKLSTSDLVEEPDLLNEYALYNQLFERQEQFHQLLQAPQAYFKTADDTEITINVSQRNWTALPSQFWTQLVVANITLLFGTFLLAFRAKGAAVYHYFAIGLCLSLAIFPASVYSTRPLALPGELFHWLSVTNHLGGLMFTAGLMSLIWCYPTAMGKFRFPLYSYIAIFVWWVFNTLQWFFPNFNWSLRFNALAALLVAAIFIAIQWRRSRDNPVHRIAVRWFLVTIFAGSTGFALIVMVPQMLGQPPLASQGIGFIAFLSIYLALAVGVSRYKLFDLDRWSFEIGLWLAYGAAIIALDIAIVALLNLTYQQATWIAIAIAGWVYFPIRQRLLQLLPSKYSASLEVILPDFVSAIAGARNNQDIIQNIRGCFNGLFNPMKSQVIKDNRQDITIAEDGLVLFIPLPYDNGTIELAYAGSGKKLFNSQDVRTTKAIIKLLEQAISAHHAKLEGMTMERNRIKQDMHDSLGGYLLAIIQQSTASPIRQLGRYAWGELRDILSSLDNEDTVIAENVNRWRAILSKLVVEEKVDLRFHVTEEVYDSHLTLNGLQRLNIGQMLREAFVNAYRHSQCSYIEIDISLAQNDLIIEVKHDGCDTPLEQWQKGRGMHHMQQRAEQLNGAIRWQSLDRHTVQLQFNTPITASETTNNMERNI